MKTTWGVSKGFFGGGFEVAVRRRARQRGEFRLQRNGCALRSRCDLPKRSAGCGEAAAPVPIRWWAAARQCASSGADRTSA